MPYQFLPQTPDGSTRLRLWPHRSLPRRGFVWFIAITAALLCLPLIALLGSVLLWALLPFPLAAIAAIWFALEHSYKTGTLTEVLTLTPTTVTLERHNPSAPDQSWQANPHWVRLTLHREGGPVPHYLTLTGNNREVELGAFLSPEERQQLYAALQDILARHRIPAP
jgi:uncharacterized membrane protein